MTDPNPIAYIAALTPAEQGMLMALVAVIGALVNQGEANREKLIDYLLGIGGDLSPDERHLPYGQTVAALAHMLEATQFPKDPNGVGGH